MKTISLKLLSVAGLILILLSPFRSSGQDSISQQSQMLDLKLQLLDSKLELLDTKIKLWEAKPKELDIKLSEIGKKVNSMDFDPRMVTRKINEMDSMMKMNLERPEPVPAESIAFVEQIPLFVPDYNSAVMLDPVRLFEGTFYLSYERKFRPALSGNIGLMATYSTEQGISNYYFSNQRFAYFNASSDAYESYEGEVMTGWGLSFQIRNYLLANHPARRKAPYGLYAAPQFLFRKMTITGNYKEMEEVEPGKWELVDKEIVQHLNINAGGVILGMKVPFFKVLVLDFFVGGNIRLSKYSDEKGFTKYKDWFNIDYSGVSPVAGIAIGILK